MNEESSGNGTTHAKYRSKFGEQAQRFPQRIRRCFMTGKQCIFCGPQTADSEADAQGRPEGEKTGRPLSVFVIMPFKPNLDTFYEWSLKRFLCEGLNIIDSDVYIRRADEFRDIGYVMCEKICRRIQEADLVVVDLSVDNPNVMYEMGIAVGLHKAILILCNKRDKPRLTEELLASVGIKDKDGHGADFQIVEYPSVGYLSAEDNDPVEMASRVPLASRKAEIKIVPLIVRQAAKPEREDQPRTQDGIPRDGGGQDRQQDSESEDSRRQDIDVTFSEAVRGAVGVAVTAISEAKSKSPALQEAVKILGDDGIERLGKITEENEVPILDAGKPRPFKDVVRSVDSAFACIIDLAGENSQSYFWLGYCHARGINAIPVYRELVTKKTKSHDTPPIAAEARAPADNRYRKKEKVDHVIAFDIRALWYIRFDPKKVKELAGSLRATLEELIAKDIPKLQRNIFWERLTRRPKIHIYTGAVHHEELRREVVGDWDQRTVSELVRYLSAGEESIVPELERPVYSPGTIASKLQESWDHQTCLEAYVDLVKTELEDHSAIIVASADVNSFTEVVLAHAYGVPQVCFHDPAKVDITHTEKRKIVVALKGWKRQNSDNESKLDAGLVEDNGGPSRSSKTETDDDCAAVGQATTEDRPVKEAPVIPTFFSRPGREENLDEGNRGFLVNNNPEPLQAHYQSQDDVSPDDEEGFHLLSHLVVMQNPFYRHNSDAIIVLLNGVSGPGTFGLAEVLTGGESMEKALVAEILLREINEAWAEREDKEREGRFGVECIIDVKIKPQAKKRIGVSPGDEKAVDERLEDTRMQTPAASKTPEQAVHEKFYDLREVVGWKKYEDDNLMDKNPRAFLM
jgi:hypothetical protein